MFSFLLVDNRYPQFSVGRKHFGIKWVLSTGIFYKFPVINFRTSPLLAHAFKTAVRGLSLKSQITGEPAINSDVILISLKIYFV